MSLLTSTGLPGGSSMATTSRVVIFLHFAAVRCYIAKRFEKTKQFPLWWSFVFSNRSSPVCGASGNFQQSSKPNFEQITFKLRRKFSQKHHKPPRGLETHTFWNFWAPPAQKRAVLRDAQDNKAGNSTHLTSDSFDNAKILENHSSLQISLLHIQVWVHWVNQSAAIV